MAFDPLTFKLHLSSFTAPYLYIFLFHYFSSSTPRHHHGWKVHRPVRRLRVNFRSQRRAFGGEQGFGHCLHRGGDRGNNGDTSRCAACTPVEYDPERGQEGVDQPPRSADPRRRPLSPPLCVALHQVMKHAEGQGRMRTSISEVDNGRSRPQEDGSNASFP
jgi:hypothetical protein